MYRILPGGGRHHLEKNYISEQVNDILKAVEEETRDHALIQSIYFSPTALTHIRRLIETGGAIVADTMLVAKGIEERLLGGNGAHVTCFIDDPEVVSIAEQRRVTRAEIAVDYGLALPGAKLMVVGSAPAALNRMIARRQREPMSDVCVLAAPSGFASVIQAKERLMDSDLNAIVVRGKKGGIPATIAIVNAILRQISESGGE